MNKAPMAATVIRLSMVKGWPNRSAAKARLATGATPIRQAATKAQLPSADVVKRSMAQAMAKSSAVKITKRPLPV